MYDADAQYTVEGRVEAKGQRKFLMFELFLSCLQNWIIQVVSPFIAESR